MSTVLVDLLIDFTSVVPPFVIKISPTSKTLDSIPCFLKVSKGSIAFHPVVVLNGCSAVAKYLELFSEYTVYSFSLCTSIMGVLLWQKLLSH